MQPPRQPIIPHRMCLATLTYKILATEQPESWEHLLAPSRSRQSFAPVFFGRKGDRPLGIDASGERFRTVIYSKHVCYLKLYITSLLQLFSPLLPMHSRPLLVSGQLSKGDKSGINALFRKALKRGLCHTFLDIDDLIITADKRLFSDWSHIQQNPLPTLPSSTAT